MTQIPHAVNPPARTLMGPGPSDIAPSVLAAMAAPTVGHLDPYFLHVMDEVQSMLRQVDKMCSHNCAVFLVACDKLGHEVEEDYLTVARHFLTLSSTNPREYSNILWVLSLRVDTPPPLVTPLCKGILKHSK